MTEIKIKNDRVEIGDVVVFCTVVKAQGNFLHFFNLGHIVGLIDITSNDYKLNYC